MRFTIVSAVYNVARYLDDFIASIEAQDHDLADLEVIMVDDGSTDGSAARLAVWQRRRPELVTVLTQANRGQAAARNLGLERASGEWVTFTDPDDMLAANVLSTVDRFVTANPTVELVALNRVVLDDRTGRRHPHALAVHFAAGDVLRNLDEHPTAFYGSAPCAFFRRVELAARGVRYDEGLRPVFEDGKLCDVYLLRAPAPLVGFLGSATYVYRKRSDGSSTLHTAPTDVARYTTVFERGYLEVLDEAAQHPGGVPDWVQTHILYELSWLLRYDEQQANPVVRDAADEVHRLLAAIAAHLSPDVVRTYSLTRFDPAWRALLLHGYATDPWHSSEVEVDRDDAQRGVQRVTYHHVGAAPSVEFEVDGVLRTPVAATTRDQPYFHRVLVHTRIAWLPRGALTVRLGGHEAPVVRPPQMARGGGLRGRLLDAAPLRRLLRDAHVYVDDAQDGRAVRQYEWTRRHRRERHAFLATDARPTVWGRRWRTVRRGSLRWRLLARHASTVIASHAIRTDARLVLWPVGPITADDAFRVNTARAALIVVGSPAERELVLADPGPFEATAFEVAVAPADDPSAVDAAIGAVSDD